MGRHADQVRHRGVARWLIAAIVTVVVLAGATVAYVIVVNRDNSAAAGACTESVVLPVAAAEGSVAAMTSAATAFDATAPTARSACVTTDVTGSSGAEIVDGLGNDWSGATGPAPTVWSPDNSGQLDGLEAASSELTSGRNDTPLAGSPVVLAVRAEDAVAVEGLAWSDLPAAIGESGDAQMADGSALRLALPDPRTNRATGYAIAGIIGADGETVDATAVGAAEKTVTEVAANSVLTSGDTDDALTELSAGTADFTAVPVVESDLAAFNTTSEALTAVYPTGPAGADAIYAVALTADWVDQTQSEAGATFHGFLQDPAGRTALAVAHVRVPGTASPPVRGIDFAADADELPAIGDDAPAALAVTLGFGGEPGVLPTTVASSSPPASRSATTTPTSSVATTAPTSPSPKPSTTPSPTPKPTPKPTPTPAGTPIPTPKPTGPVVTFLVDSSQTMGTVVEGQSRLGYAQQGLREAVTALAAGDAGLWAYSSAVAATGFDELVATGPVAGRTGPLGQAIDGLAAGGTRTTYAAVVAAYQSASDKAVAGRPNRVLLITDGVDQTQGVSRDEVIGQLQAIRDQGKGVQLVILGVGEVAPDEALTQLAQAGGGSYTDVPQSPGLPAAIVAAAVG